MPVLLPCIFILCHGLALALFPAHARPISFGFLIAAPLLAGVVSVRRCRDGALKGGWIALALAMLSWAGGMAAGMYQEVFLANVDTTPGLSMLLYVLYGVPLTFVLASSENEVWHVRLIDGVLALMLGYLFFVHTFSFATASSATPQGIVNLRLMFDIENAFILAFAMVRYVASGDAASRGFFRVLAIFALVYMLAAFYINHLEPEDVDYGGFGDLVIDVPFLVLVAIAGIGSSRGGIKPSTRLAHIVRAGSPLMLPVTLLVVSSFIVRRHLDLAVAGFVVATLGYGLRSVLTQVRSFEHERQLDELARIDTLTGLANRRQFDEVLRHEWNRAQRSGEGLALLMIDIDHFKAFNDTFGHQEGDLCLRDVAQVLANTASRGSDLVARYGGEEFAVVLSSTTFEQACQVAESMRASVHRQLAVSREGLVTVSIGTGFMQRTNGGDAAELFAAADAALYEAKRTGRNRVVSRNMSVRSATIPAHQRG
ncbi:diguanylate cyclase [Rhodanobacter sp. Col0626]|uniref:GGDEF domain-containing protein n=1 Tax=Rhodanobacter sp. Col0626 TaxID=3415679 RepID=UPI003CF51D96